MIWKYLMLKFGVLGKFVIGHFFAFFFPTQALKEFFVVLKFGEKTFKPQTVKQQKITLDLLILLILELELGCPYDWEKVSSLVYRNDHTDMILSQLFV